MVKTTIYLALALWLAAIPVMLVWSLPTQDEQKQREISDNKTQEKEGSYHEGAAMRVRIIIRETARYIHENRDDIAAVSTTVIAIFTIVLGVFTINLAGSTRITAEAARKAAQTAEDALTKVERPYIFVIGVERFGIDQFNKTVVKFKAANYGKTPAVIEGVRGGVSVSKRGIPDLPTSTELIHGLLASPIIAAGGVTHELSVEITEIRTFAYNLSSRLTTVRLSEGEDIFFNIIICYRGAFSYGHESGACWRYDKTTARLIPYGGKDYNYVK
jgi:hypothetical protein